jgi:hypothetical protein
LILVRLTGEGARDGAKLRHLGHGQHWGLSLSGKAV